MTVEIYGSVWEIDHVFPVSKSNLIFERENYKSTHWSKLKPMYCSENTSKGAKINHHLYLLQQIKGKCFSKLNDQDQLTEDFYS